MNIKCLKNNFYKNFKFRKTFFILNSNKFRRKITDQPGRFLAITVFSPTIAYKGYIYDDSFLLAFASILFTWDLYWIICKPSIKIMDE